MFQFCFPLFKTILLSKGLQTKHLNDVNNIRTWRIICPLCHRPNPRSVCSCQTFPLRCICGRYLPTIVFNLLLFCQTRFVFCVLLDCIKNYILFASVDHCSFLLTVSVEVDLCKGPCVLFLTPLTGFSLSF